MVNDDPNQVKILKFRTHIEEVMTTFEKIFFEYILLNKCKKILQFTFYIKTPLY